MMLHPDFSFTRILVGLVLLTPLTLFGCTNNSITGADMTTDAEAPVQSTPPAVDRLPDDAANDLRHPYNGTDLDDQTAGEADDGEGPMLTTEPKNSYNTNTE